MKEPGYRINRPTTCKEYGASWFLIKENEEVIDKLKNTFPIFWKELFVLSVCRLLYQSPLKHIELHYQDSWVSEVYQGISLSKNVLHQILEDIGRNRESITKFLRSFVKGKRASFNRPYTYIFLIG